VVRVNLDELESAAPYEELAPTEPLDLAFLDS